MDNSGCQSKLKETGKPSKLDSCRVIGFHHLISLKHEGTLPSQTALPSSAGCNTSSESHPVPSAAGAPTAHCPGRSQDFLEVGGKQEKCHCRRH